MECHRIALQHAPHHSCHFGCLDVGSGCCQMGIAVRTLQMARLHCRPFPPLHGHRRFKTCSAKLSLTFDCAVLVAATTIRQAATLDQFALKCAAVDPADANEPQMTQVTVGAAAGEMAVSWATLARNAPSFVEIGTEGNDGPFPTRFDGSATPGYTVPHSTYTSRSRHRVVLTGLVPGTRYYYSIAGGAKAAGQFVYRGVALAARDRPLTMAIVGDLDQSVISQRTLRGIAAIGADLDGVQLLGDLSYANTGRPPYAHELWDSWQRLVTPLASRCVVPVTIHL